MTNAQWLRVLLDKPNAQVPKSAEIVSFFAQKLEINYGEEVEITWRVKDAVIVSLNGKVLPDLQKGSLKVKPFMDVTYLLSATGTDGKAINNTLAIKVLPTSVQPVIKNLNTPVNNPVPPTTYIPPVQTMVTPVQTQVTTPTQTPVQTSVTLPETNLWGERIAALFSVGAVFMALRVIYVINEWASFGLLATALGGLTYFLSRRFESFAAVKERMLVEKEILRNETDKKQTEKQIGILQNQAKEMESGEAKQKQSLEQQIKDLQAKEKFEKQQVTDKYQQQIQPIQGKIKDLKQQEDTELQQELEKLYQKVLDRELPLYLVMLADIDGFQPLFKTELTLNGILSAADIVDVDKQGNILKRNGEWVRVSMLTVNKVEKLWEWKKNAVERIRKQYPQALSADKKHSIRQKYTTQIQDLSFQETTLQAQVQQQLQAISSQYSQQISSFQLQLKATGSLKRQTLEQQIQQSKQVLQQFEFQGKKLQNDLQSYQQVSFWQYLGKVFGIFA